jgi:glutamyl-tRNA reductase
LELLLYGTNHTLLDVDQREQFALSQDELPEVLQSLAAREEVREVCVLSTCNRVEFLFVAREAFCVPRVVREELQERKGVDIREWPEGFYFYENAEAVEHLFRVITSLDSMVIGEVDIIHQVKEMYQIASDAGTTDIVLDRLFHQAFKIGKQTRTDTDISMGTMSVAMAAVEQLQHDYGDLSDRDALVVGGGKMARQAARYLDKRGIRSLRIANRTLDNVRHHAERLGAQLVPLQELTAHVAAVDVLIISIDYENDTLLTTDDLAALDAQRDERRLTVVDISVPRVVAHTEGSFESLSVLDIEDFEEVLNENYRKRQAAVTQVEQIIEKAVRRFTHWQREAVVLPDIIELRRKVKAIAEEEVEKRNGELPEDAEKTIKELTNSITERIIDVPIRQLKDAVLNQGDDAQLEHFRRLFSLGEPDQPDDTAAGERDKSGVVS